MVMPQLLSAESRSFFARAAYYGIETEVLSEGRLGDLQEQIAAISHKLFITRSRNLSSSQEAAGSVNSAFATVSLGLEYASENSVAEAALLLVENGAVLFFRIGNTLLNKLISEAKDVRAAAVLVSPPQMPGLSRAQEEIELYNSYERLFLDALSRGQINIAIAELRLTARSLARPISTLQDVSAARAMLDYLRYRSAYLHTLPLEQIFDTEFPPDEHDDMAFLITKQLIINIALFRQPEFHVTEEDLRNFWEICCETEDGTLAKLHQDAILGWIRHHLHLHGAGHEVRRYTVAYWRACLKALERGRAEVEPSHVDQS